MTLRDALKYTLLFYELQEQANWDTLSSNARYAILVNMLRLGPVTSDFNVLKYAWRDQLVDAIHQATGNPNIDRDRLEIDQEYFDTLQDVEDAFLLANPQITILINQPVSYTIFKINIIDMVGFNADDLNWLEFNFQEIFNYN